MKKFFGAVIAILLGSQMMSNAQGNEQHDLAIRNLPDTIMGKRTLIVPDPFNAGLALRKLFPGKYYDLSSKNYSNKLISWSCKGCKPKVYADVNQVEDPVPFPYAEGVATRLMNELDFADSSGNKYKLISFNHSSYDPDGLQTGRFTGGLIGMAKFNKTDSGWRLQAFQPAIGAYGSFAQAPYPEAVRIGDDQFAFILEHVNGGAGGPFDHDYYLIAGQGGQYRQILAAYQAGRSPGEDSICTWESTYSVAPGEKKYFRDIVILCKGTYWAADTDGLPAELKGKVQGKEHGSFTIKRVYVYSAKGGYVLADASAVSIKPAK